MSPQKRFRKLLHLTVTNFLLSGVRITHDFGHVRNAVFDRMYYFSITLWIFHEVLAEIVWTIKGMMSGQNFEEVTLMVPCFFTCIIGSSKILPLYVRRQVLVDIIERLTVIHPELPAAAEMKTDNGKLRYELIRSAEDNFRTIKNVYILMALSVFIPFCLVPIFYMIYEKLAGVDVEPMLPYKVDYFVDHTKKYFFPLIYFHQIVTTLYVTFHIMGADSAFYGFCNFIQMHFKLLKSDIENFVAEKWDERKSGDIYEQFKVFIKRHQFLTELVDKIEELYSYSALFNIIASSFVICLSCFNASATSDMMIVMNYAGFLFMSLAQIYIFCYGGDMIMRSSTDLSHGLYNCRWYLADTKLKQSMVFMLARAQKPCKLTAASFSDLNLSAFATILRRSYSYFALLKTMNQE